MERRAIGGASPSAAIFILVPPRENLLEALVSVLVERALNFDLQTFASLPLPKQHEYAKTHLVLIGEGGGRFVFDMSNGFVLKLAKTNVGFANGVLQNKNELKRYPALSKLGIVPQIETADTKNNQWIIMERVSVIENDDDVVQLTDLYWNEMEHLFGLVADEVYTPDQVLNPEKYPELQEEVLEETDFGGPWRENPFTRALIKAVEFGLGPEEILVPSHLGQTQSGRPVIVDFGF